MKFEMPKMEINKFDLITCTDTSGPGPQTETGRNLYDTATGMSTPTGVQGRATVVLTF